jgi:hypothetical protein
VPVPLELAALAVFAGVDGVAAGPWPPLAATFSERKSMRASCAVVWSW